MTIAGILTGLTRATGRQVDNILTSRVVRSLSVGNLSTLVRRVDVDNLDPRVHTRIADAVSPETAKNLVDNLDDDQLAEIMAKNPAAGRKIGSKAAEAVGNTNPTLLARLQRAGMIAATSTGRLCRRNAAMCIGGPILAYLVTNHADASENVKVCMKYCLPSNWPEYDADVTTNLQYQTTSSIRSEFNDNFPEEFFKNQPYCTPDHVDNETCESHCRNACESVHESVLDRAVDAGSGLLDAVPGLLDLIEKLLEFMRDPWQALLVVVIGIVALVVVIAVIKALASKVFS